MPRLPHTPPADTDTVERRAGRNAYGIGSTAEHTAQQTVDLASPHRRDRRRSIAPLSRSPRTSYGPPRSTTDRSGRNLT
ncbi:hypothetical protein [Streptomyces noursei]|uniref:hypothetical protein n=1 Tax=Streptomyces noursei TaxID=1971 RepID=UPI0030F35B1C